MMSGDAPWTSPRLMPDPADNSADTAAVSPVYSTRAQSVVAGNESK